MKRFIGFEGIEGMVFIDVDEIEALEVKLLDGGHTISLYTVNQNNYYLKDTMTQKEANEELKKMIKAITEVTNS